MGEGQDCEGGGWSYGPRAEDTEFEDIPITVWERYCSKLLIQMRYENNCIVLGEAHKKWPGLWTLTMGAGTAIDCAKSRQRAGVA